MIDFWRKNRERATIVKNVFYLGNISQVFWYSETSPLLQLKQNLQYDSYLNKTLTLYVQYLVSKTWKALSKKRVLKKCWLWFSCDITSLIYFMTLFITYVFSSLIDLAVFIDLTVLLWLRHMLLFSVFTRAGSSSGLILAQSFNSPLDARYGYSSDSIQLYYFLLFLFKFRFSGVENHDFACVTRHQPTTW